MLQLLTMKDDVRRGALARAPEGTMTGEGRRLRLESFLSPPLSVVLSSIVE